jgi:excinuclease UvrABC helicase subunit UvrB
MDTEFEIIAPFKPIGDQPAEIEQIVVKLQNPRLGLAIAKPNSITVENGRI